MIVSNKVGGVGCKILFGKIIFLYFIVEHHTIAFDY